MKKEYVKSVFLFLIVLLIMVGVTTVSATNDNTTSNTFAQNTTTDDTVILNDQTSNMLKQETKTIENKEIKKKSTNETINKSTTTKSAKEPSVNQENVKSDVTFYIDSTSGPPILNQEYYCAVVLYDENYEFMPNQEIIFKFDDTITQTQGGSYGSYYTYFTPQKFGECTLNITFTGNDNYNQKSIIETINVTKPLPVNNWVNLDTKVQLGEKITLSGMCSDDNVSYYQDKPVSIIYDDIHYTTYIDENGLYSFEIIPQEIGEYTLSVNIDETEDFDNLMYTFYITVTKGKVTYLHIYPETYYVNLGDQAIIKGYMKDNNGTKIANQKFNVQYEDNEFSIFSDNNGDFTCNITRNTLGMVDVSVIYEGSEEYASTSEWCYIEFVEQKDSKLTITSITPIDADKFVYGGNILVNATLTDSEGNPIFEMIGTDILDGVGYNVQVCPIDDKYSFDVPVNKVGNINITLIFDGSSEYKKAKDTMTIQVEKANGNISVYEIDSVDVFNPVNIEGSFFSNTDLVLVVNKEEIPITTDEWGRFSYEYVPQVAGENNVTVKFEGNEYYYPTNITMSFYVYKIYPQILVEPITDVEVGSIVKIKGKLTYIDNPIQDANITIRIGDETYNVITNETGDYSLDYHAVYGGYHNVYVSCDESNSEHNQEDSTSFYVNDDRTPVDLYFNDIGTSTIGETINVTGSLHKFEHNDEYDYNYYTSLDNTQIILQYDGLNYSVVTDENGCFNKEFVLNKLGSIEIYAICEGSETYQACIKKIQFEVIKEKVTKLNVEHIHYADINDPAIINGFLSLSNGTKIANQKFIVQYGYDEFDISSYNEFNISSDNNGDFTFNITSDDLGTMFIKITYEGSEEYAATYEWYVIEFVEQKDSELTITSITNPEGGDIVYGGIALIEGTLMVSDGDFIDGDIYINNKYVTDTTDGVFSVMIPVEDIGSVNLTVLFKGNSEYKKSNCTMTIQVEKSNKGVILEDIGNVDIYTPVNITGVSEKNVDLILVINNDEIPITTDDEGMFSYEYVPQVGGDNNITVKFEGNDYYYPTNSTGSFYVYKLHSILTADFIDNVDVGSVVKITGKLVGVENEPIKDATINIVIRGDECIAVTNETGDYSLDYRTVYGGYSVAYISFEGNDLYSYQQFATSFEVYDDRNEVTLYLDNIGISTIGDTINVTGLLNKIEHNDEYNYDDYIPLDNVQVILQYDGMNYSVVTDENGCFNKEFVLNKLGNIEVSAIYEGNETYQATFDKIYIDVLQERMSYITANFDTQYADKGEFATIKGWLRDQNYNGISNQTIIIQVNDEYYETITNSTGEFSYKIPCNDIGTLWAFITYDGKEIYTNSSDETCVEVVEREETILKLEEVYSEAENISHGSLIYVKGTLTDSKGNPIEYAFIKSDGGWFEVVNGTFKMEHSVYGVGKLNLTAYFEGDSEYKPSNDTVYYEASKSIYNPYSVYVIPQITIDSRQLIEIYADGAKVNVKINNKTINTINENEYTYAGYNTTIEDLGTNMVIIEFYDHPYYESAVITKFFNVTNTLLSIENIDPIDLGENVTLTGRLIDNLGKVIPNANIEIEALGETFNVKTDNEGIYSINYKPPVPTYVTINVLFVGDENNYPSTTSTCFEVNPVSDKNTRIFFNETEVIFEINDEMNIAGYLEAYSSYFDDDAGVWGEIIEEISETNITLQYGGNNYTVPLDKNNNFNYSLKLDKPGNHTIRLLYEGNTTFNPSLELIQITVNKKNTTITINPINTRVSQTINLTANVKDYKQNNINEGNVIFKFNNETIKDEKGNELQVPVKNGIATTKYTVPESWLNQNNKIEAIFIESNTYYSSENQTSNITIIPKYRNTKITINPINTTTITSTVKVTGKLIDEDNKAITNAKINIQINNQTFTTNTNKDGVYTVNYTTTTLGTTNIIATYTGARDYNASNTTSKFTVTKKDTKITINPINNVTPGENTKITGTIETVDNKALKDATITITINNNNYSSKTDTNGKFTVPYKTNKTGTYEVAVSYTGDASHNPSQADTKFIVNKITTVITVNTPSNITYGNNVIINGTLKDNQNNHIQNNNINVKVNGNNFTVKSDANGEYKLTINTYSVGENNVTVSFTGNSTHQASTASTKFNVEQADTCVTINKINNTDYGSIVTVTGTLKDYSGHNIANNDLTVKVNANTITLKTDNDGKFTFKTNATKIGNNIVTVNYKGNTQYKPSSNNTSFIAGNAPTIITINTVKDTDYLASTTVTGTFKDAAGNILYNSNLLASVNGKSFTIKTDREGKYSFVANASRVGKNFISVYFRGNSLYKASSNSTTFLGKNAATFIELNPVKDINFGDSVTVTGTFKDAAGNLLFNSNVLASVNGKSFTFKTDSKGKFSFDANASRVGKNFISVYFRGNSLYKASSNSTTFLGKNAATFIELDAVKDVDFGDSVTVTGTFKDAAGNLLFNSNVLASVNGKSFTVKTDSKGRFSFVANATLPARNFISVYFRGNALYKPSSSTTNFIARNVGTQLTLNKISNAKVGKNLTISGTFKDVLGNPMFNSNVQVKLNNKPVFVKTNDKGVFNYTTTITQPKNAVNVFFKGNSIYKLADKTVTFTATAK